MLGNLCGDLSQKQLVNGPLFVQPVWNVTAQISGPNAPLAAPRAIRSRPAELQVGGASVSEVPGWRRESRTGLGGSRHVLGLVSDCLVWSA